MEMINGIYAFAKIHTTNNELNKIDDYALAQIKMLCDNECLKDCKICVMPDVHPGKVGTVGLTTTIGKRIMPMLIGIDIGCGMSLARVKAKRMEFERLDNTIRENI